MAGEEGVGARPCGPLGAPSSLQPFAPQLDDMLAMPARLPNLPRAAVVCHVTDEFGREAIVLPAQRLVAVGATPLVDRCQRTGQTVLCRRLPHPVLAFPRLPPRVGEAEEVEPWFAASRLRAATPLRPEVDEARLVGM